MTPRDLIRNTADVFRRAGIPDPEYDSAMLLSSLTGRSSLPLRMDTDTVLDEDTIARFQALCSRRIGREPLQYILSDAYFCGFRFPGRKRNCSANGPWKRCPDSLIRKDWTFAAEAAVSVSR